MLKTRSRAWCFTVFNYGAELENICKRIEPIAKYYVIGEEICPSTGKAHLQGYAYFNNAITGGNLKNKLNKGAHIEKAKGSPKENREYCIKEGKFIEFGELPEQGKRSDLMLLKDQIISGQTTVNDIVLNDPDSYHMYGRTLEKIEDLKANGIYRTEMTKCDWIYGPTGVGKSHKAFENYSKKTHYVFPDDNGWWDGYKQQDTVIINDFRGNIKYGELLQLIDKWPHSVKRRNREPIEFVSSKIIITSSLHPSEIYANVDKKDHINQLLRRINLINMEEASDNSLNEEF